MPKAQEHQGRQEHFWLLQQCGTNGRPNIIKTYCYNKTTRKKKSTSDTPHSRPSTNPQIFQITPNRHCSLWLVITPVYHSTLFIHHLLDYRNQDKKSWEENGVKAPSGEPAIFPDERTYDTSTWKKGRICQVEYTTQRLYSCIVLLSRDISGHGSLQRCAEWALDLVYYGTHTNPVMINSTDKFSLCLVYIIWDG